MKRENRGKTTLKILQKKKEIEGIRKNWEEIGEKNRKKLEETGKREETERNWGKNWKQFPGIFIFRGDGMHTRINGDI